MSVLRTPVSKQTDSTFSQDSSRVPEVSTSISRESKISDSLEDSNLEHPIADLKGQSSPSLNSKTATFGGEAGFRLQGGIDPDPQEQSSTYHTWRNFAGDQTSYPKKFSQTHFKGFERLKKKRGYERWIRALYAVWSSKQYDDKDVVFSLVAMMDTTSTDDKVVAARRVLDRWNGSAKEALDMLQTLFMPDNLETLLTNWSDLAQHDLCISEWYATIVALAGDLRAQNEMVSAANMKMVFVRKLNQAYKAQLESMFPLGSYRDASLSDLVSAFSGWEQRNPTLVQSYLRQSSKDQDYTRENYPRRPQSSRSMYVRQEVSGPPVNPRLDKLEQKLGELVSMVSSMAMPQDDDIADLNHRGELFVTCMVQRSFPQNCWRCWADDGHRAMRCTAKVPPQLVWDRSRKMPVCPLCKGADCRRDVCPQNRDLPPRRSAWNQPGPVLDKNGMPITVWNERLRSQVCYSCRRATCSNDPCQKLHKIEENVSRWADISLDAEDKKNDQ